MRVVAWNCNRGFADDHEALRAHGTDVAVLAEVPRVLPAALAGPPASWCWIGDTASTGLAVAGYTVALRPAAPTRTGPPPARWATRAVGDRFDVLGIWSCPSTGATFAGEVLRAVRAHEHAITERPHVVAGDLNTGGRTVDDRAAFAELLELLDRLGYVSAYHHWYGEPIGAETRATYFHRRDPSQRFHVDWVFVHRDLLGALRSVEVGEYERWVAGDRGRQGLSDHVPLVVDLDV